MKSQVCKFCGNPARRWHEPHCGNAKYTQYGQGRLKILSLCQDHERQPDHRSDDQRINDQPRNGREQRHCLEGSGKPLDVVVHAPRITRFSLKGSDTLVLEGFDQPELTIETVGRAEVHGSGRAGRVRLQLQGIGWVDLSSLAASEADVTLSGSRHALLSASEKASISGNGSVVLVSKPRALELNLGDSGRVFTLGQ